MTNQDKLFTVSIISQKETYRVTTALTDASKITLLDKLSRTALAFMRSDDEILYITVKRSKLKY